MFERCWDVFKGSSKFSIGKIREIEGRKGRKRHPGHTVAVFDHIILISVYIDIFIHVVDNKNFKMVFTSNITLV